MSDDWRADLADAIARGLAENGWDAVVDALGEHGDELAVHPDAPIEALQPELPVLAVTACEAGVVGVLVASDSRVSVHQSRSAAGLLEQIRETCEPGLVALTGDLGTEAEVLSALPTEVVEPYAGTATAEDRRESLRLAGLTVPAWFAGSGFTEDELLDVCGALVVAVGRTGTMER